jgi:nitrogen fixation protein FixH
MADKNSAWRSPWVIAWVAMVVIFFSMNMIMIFMAADNNPGLVVDDYYERGQDYEKNMLKRRARDPGWEMQLHMPKLIEAVDQPVICRFSVRDKDGLPVTPEAVTFYAYRPSDAKHDFSVPMREIEPGVYQAEISFPLRGAWDTLVSVKQGQDEYSKTQRIGVGMDWVP